MYRILGWHEQVYWRTPSFGWCLLSVRNYHLPCLCLSFPVSHFFCFLILSNFIVAYFDTVSLSLSLRLCFETLQPMKASHTTAGLASGSVRPPPNPIVAFSMLVLLQHEPPFSTLCLQFVEMFSNSLSLDIIQLIKFMKIGSFDVLLFFACFWFVGFNYMQFSHLGSSESLPSLPWPLLVFPLSPSFSSQLIFWVSPFLFLCLQVCQSPSPLGTPNIRLMLFQLFSFQTP